MILSDDNIQALRDAEPDELKKHIIGSWVEWLVDTNDAGYANAGVDCRVISFEVVEGKENHAMIGLAVASSMDTLYVGLEPQEMVTIGPSLIPTHTVVATVKEADIVRKFMTECFENQPRPNHYWPAA